MSDALTALVVSLIFAALLFLVAMLIRVRGPQGLVKGVDWTRVSDIEGLGQFVSLVMTILAALISARGVVLYVFHDEPALRNVGSIVLVVLIVVASLALLVGRRRYQDRRPRDGR